MLNKVLTDNCVSEKCRETMMSLGFLAVRLPSFSGLPSPVCSHPDMLCFKNRRGELIITKDYYERERIFFDSLGIKIIASEEKLLPNYPKDVLFDALSVNGIVFGKKGCVSRFILEESKEFVSVNQGYARCSVAMLSDNCAVTADSGLFSALTEKKIKTLLIRNGNIVLKGYDTGFIGGAGGRLPNGRYCFFGDIMSHPDGAMILEFAKENKVKAVSLSDEPLSDHGGFVCI